MLLASNYEASFPTQLCLVPGIVKRLTRNHAVTLLNAEDIEDITAIRPSDMFLGCCVSLFSRFLVDFLGLQPAVDGKS